MKKKLIPRETYLNQINKFRDTDFIKILTGMRRSGKSSILKLIMDQLKDEGINSDQIIEMNFTYLDFNEMDYKELYQYIKSRYNRKKLYLFFDEIQEINNWEKAINSIREEIDCDIYLTGSNANLLAGEFATYLSGRYVLFEIYPLSFNEYLNFMGLTAEKNDNLNGTSNYLFKTKSGEIIDSTAILNRFIQFGSMPEVSFLNQDYDYLERILEGIYQTVFIRDIINRLENTNSNLLERIIRFLAGNIGNRVSPNSIRNTLVSSGVETRKTTFNKVQKYIDTCVKAYLFNSVKRFNIRGKEELTTLGKYYITDLGIRNIILQNRPGNRGFILENLVYLELVKRGFKVNVGKKDKTEIDFIAQKKNKVFYIQVTQSLEEKSTFDREIKPLKKLEDSYKRLIITENLGLYPSVIKGVEIVPLLDFLIDESILN